MPAMDQDESHAQESKVERRDRREGKKFGLIHLHIDRYERVSRKIFPQIKNCLFNRLRNMFLFFKHDVSSIWKKIILNFPLLIKMYTHLSALHSTDREHLSVWHGQANRNAFGHRTAVGIKSVLMRTLKLDHTAMLLLPNVTSPTHSCSFSSLFYPTLPL